MKWYKEPWRHRKSPGFNFKESLYIVLKISLGVSDSFYVIKNTKIKSVSRFRFFLCSLMNYAFGRLRFFSNENIFTLNTKMNHRSDHWLIQKDFYVWSITERVSHKALQTGIKCREHVFASGRRLKWWQKQKVLIYRMHVSRKCYINKI